MMPRLLPLLLVPLIITIASARADAQSTAPVVDLSSPRAAAQSLYEAAARGDGEALRQIFYAETDAQRQLADAYADMIVSTKRLADAAQARFGGAADAFAQGARPTEDLKRLEAAEVKADGPDRASIRLPLAPRAMNFRRTERGWQLVISDFAGAAPERLGAQIAMTRDITAVMDDVADDIESGQHATAQEAEQAIQQRMNEVMTRALKSNLPTPAPAPSTAPATQPQRE